MPLTNPWHVLATMTHPRRLDTLRADTSSTRPHCSLTRPRHIPNTATTRPRHIPTRCALRYPCASRTHPAPRVERPTRLQPVTSPDQYLPLFWPHPAIPTARKWGMCRPPSICRHILTCCALAHPHLDVLTCRALTRSHRIRTSAHRISLRQRPLTTKS